jgi:hypothetical protein
MSVAGIRQARTLPHFLPIPKNLVSADLPASTLIVYSALRYHARQRNMCRVRIDTLVATSGRSRASVVRALKLLRLRKLVGSLRTGRSSYYILYEHWDDGDEAAPTASPCGDSPSPSSVDTTPPPHSRTSAPRTDPSVDNSAKAHFALIHQKDSAKAVLLTCTSEQTSTIAQDWSSPPVDYNDISPDIEYKTDLNAPQLAALRSYVSTPIREGGLGWRLHRGNRERLDAYVAQVGVNAAWIAAYKADHAGRDGGAAYWDWTLSKAGHKRKGLTR